MKDTKYEDWPFDPRTIPWSKEKLDFFLKIDLWNFDIASTFLVLESVDFPEGQPEPVFSPSTEFIYNLLKIAIEAKVISWKHLGKEIGLTPIEVYLWANTKNIKLPSAAHEKFLEIEPIKLLPNQEDKIVCQGIAKGIWRKNPDYTIQKVSVDSDLKLYANTNLYRYSQETWKRRYLRFSIFSLSWVVPDVQLNPALDTDKLQTACAARPERLGLRGSA